MTEPMNQYLKYLRNSRRIRYLDFESLFLFGIAKEETKKMGLFEKKECEFCGNSSGAINILDGYKLMKAGKKNAAYVCYDCINKKKLNGYVEYYYSIANEYPSLELLNDYYEYRENVCETIKLCPNGNSSIISDEKLHLSTNCIGSKSFDYVIFNPTDIVAITAKRIETIPKQGNKIPFTYAIWTKIPSVPLLYSEFTAKEGFLDKGKKNAIAYTGLLATTFGCEYHGMLSDVMSKVKSDNSLDNETKSSLVKMMKKHSSITGFSINEQNPLVCQNLTKFINEIYN